MHNVQVPIWQDTTGQLEKGLCESYSESQQFWQHEGKQHYHRWFYCCGSVYVIKLGVDKVICRTIMLNAQ